jgi:hypothetical protein
MTDQRVLNPVGAIDRAAASITRPARAASAKKPVIGLLDNSKPNVALFLHTLRSELERSGEYEIVTTVKPRSAAPAPDIEALARRCQYVINAVGD